MLVVCSCATQKEVTAEERQSLAGNGRLPEQEIRPFFSDEEWGRICDQRYAGYVVIRVQIRPDRSVSDLRVVEAIPDHSRDRLAREFAASTRLFAPTIATRTTPSGEVYIVFYESDTPHRALVFGRHISAASPVSYTRGDRYLKVFLY